MWRSGTHLPGKRCRPRSRGAGGTSCTRGCATCSRRRAQSRSWSRQRLSRPASASERCRSCWPPPSGSAPCTPTATPPGRRVRRSSSGRPRPTIRSGSRPSRGSAGACSWRVTCGNPFPCGARSSTAARGSAISAAARRRDRQLGEALDTLWSRRGRVRLADSPAADLFAELGNTADAARARIWAAGAARVLRDHAAAAALLRQAQEEARSCADEELRLHGAGVGGPRAGDAGPHRRRPDAREAGARGGAGRLVHRGGLGGILGAGRDASELGRC